MNSNSEPSQKTAEDAQPRAILLTVPSTVEHALDLYELALFVRRRLLVVAGAALLLGAAAAAYAFLKEPEYEGTTILAPASDDVPQASLGGLGGLASLAGIQLSGSAGKAEKVALLRSRGLAEDFIRDKGLLQQIFAREWDAETRSWKADSGEVVTLQRAYKVFSSNILEVDENVTTGLVTVTVRWTDPEAAATWANELVARANGVARDRAIEEARQTIDYLYKELDMTPVVELRQGIYDLIEAHINRMTIARARSEYAFRVVDRARPSDRDQQVWPRRGLIIAVGILLGALFALVTVVLAGVVKQVFVGVEAQSGQPSPPRAPG